MVHNTVIRLYIDESIQISSNIGPRYELIV